MAGSDTVTDSSRKATAARVQSKDEAQWPLTYKMQTAKKVSTLQAFGVRTDQSVVAKKPWWSHTLYRGPADKPVEILYSKTKEQSEALAQLFVSESIIGFDMEWPCFKEKSPKLQDKIGLIQIATQEKVALFHIGLHPGKTTADIIAPTLRKIIENPAIGKVGVGILNADFTRLSKFFGLEPQGAVELSHLHRLVVFGGRRPELVSTKLVSLAQLVEKHLGLPLYKGEVRTSNWSRPLLESQINYAAGDAYAGFMLYHCMNAKRLDMKPAPPLPIHADKYQAMTRKIPKIGRLYLEPVEEGGNFTPSDVFFGDPTRVDRVGSLENADEACREMAVARKKETTSTSAATMTTRPEKMTANCLDESSQRLYGKLASRRKTLADAASVPLYRVAHNVVLEGLARERPLDTGALLKIRGVGKHQQEKYGDMWIEVIKEFVAADEIGQRATTTAISACTGRPCTGNDSKEKGESAREETPDSSPAFEAPPRPRTAQLHTGLSFTLAETSLSKSVSCSDDSDSSLVLLEFSELSSRRSSGQKRKRAGNRLQASDARAQSMQTVARACGDESREAVGQTMETRIFRNKLVALSKLVGRKVPSRCAEAAQVVSDDTLDSIVAKRPRTHDELRQIGGIEMFVQACVEADVDLLKNIVRFTPAET